MKLVRFRTGFRVCTFAERLTENRTFIAYTCQEIYISNDN